MRHNFHPLLEEWFTERFGTPTAPQDQAWQKAEEGKHFLLSAPTGSGKTLAAFFWALNRIIRGDWPEEGITILYISPLKALNNDIRENLEGPLAEITTLAGKNRMRIPPVRIAVRSGDTSPGERQKQLRRPPQIFITTPESLNLILTSPRGQDVFPSLKLVILDEIHNIMAGKRGTHLISAVERLTLQAGEFQRVGLSATVRPIERAAAFLGGFYPDGRPRRVETILPKNTKRKEIQVIYPFIRSDDPENPLAPLVERIRGRIAVNRSTLVFVRTRSMAEKLTRMINGDETELLAYAHHGSLSREIRYYVEQKLKKGELKAIIATSSLELGIDIGQLDEVLLVGNPLSSSSLIQRIGRSGHAVGMVSRGKLYPTGPQDLLFAAAAARSCLADEVEEMHTPEAPLDILCQTILSMCVTAPWQEEELYAFLKQIYSYSTLKREQFDRVIGMLTGRYADSRVRELTPRLDRDRDSGLLRARKQASSLLYLSGGTIPDRGLYEMRLAEGGSKIGELDEEFVWENRVGTTFPMGTQMWKITRITDRDVEVVPTGEKASTQLFWKGEGQYGPALPAMRTGELLEELSRLKKEESIRRLVQSCSMEEESAAYLMEELEDYRLKSGCPWPHKNRVVLEVHPARRGGAGELTYVIHTFRGGQVNLLLGICLASHRERETGQALPFVVDEASILFHLPEFQEGEELIRPLSSENLEDLIRNGLESSPFFGTHFRETASRALLLPRRNFRQRLPLWMSRMKASRLLTAVAGYEDFPILAETWRTCLQDETHPLDLQIFLDQISAGEVEVQTVRPSEIPRLSLTIMGRETAAMMYNTDTPYPGLVSDLSTEIIREMLAGSLFRPRIKGLVIQELERRKQRREEGYLPSDPEDLLHLLQDRELIPREEWEQLLEGMEKGFKKSAKGPEWEDLLILIHAGIDASAPGYILPAGRKAPDMSGSSLLNWLSYYGPLPLSRLAGLFGGTPDQWRLSLLEGEAEDQLLIDYLSEDAQEPEVCLKENMEILLRMQRKPEAPAPARRKAEELPLFLLSQQTRSGRTESMDEFQSVLEPLLGYPAPAGLWEKEILPARCGLYRPEWLDTLLMKEDLVWAGKGKSRILFSLGSEYPLLRQEQEETPDEGEKALLEELKKAPGDYSSLRNHLPQLSASALTDALWGLVWKGEISNSDPETLRRGILADFKTDSPGSPEPGRTPSAFSSRRRFSRWKQARPIRGNWFPLPEELSSEDLLEQEEREKELVRLLLDRYGILFRQLIGKDESAGPWSRVFRILRLMEFSGEVVSGAFFKGIEGIQFMTPKGLRMLEQGMDQERVWWTAARDPVSPCGWGIKGLKGLPPRAAGNYLCWQGSRLVMTARKSGRDLYFQEKPDQVPPGPPDLLFQHLLGRRVSPEIRIILEHVNREPVLESPYVSFLESIGFRKDYKRMIRHGNPH